ncbi:hypothetical protein AZE42_02891 [Rhizopogon vesiculosus]|uniref:Uncharacterized protein n=1 Tax=Rhizopogon vesiculosus TaxID=180088 RepID=A0A1J8PUH9_9AGAM|nr:hypothetical protein AZE42_02891 [Rhizopogon vesiculosus]
MESLALARLT